MSPASPKRAVRSRHTAAIRFAALGDHTRLSLVGRLAKGSPLSITALTDGSDLTRQAITKHLHVLEEAGLVRNIRHGRETLFQVEPRSLESARDALDRISRQWDEALMRLKSHVESGQG